MSVYSISLQTSLAIAGFPGSLVPSPTPSFLSLLSTVLSSDEKLGMGLGTRLLHRYMYHWHRHTPQHRIILLLIFMTYVVTLITVLTGAMVKISLDRGSVQI